MSRSPAPVNGRASNLNDDWYTYCFGAGEVAFYLIRQLEAGAGALSLVGPHPHALQAKAADRLYDEVVDGYCARHEVKPGMTGWAQSNGWCGETDTAGKIEKRFEHDLFHTENWSLPLDLYVLARTPVVRLKAENAY